MPTEAPNTGCQYIGRGPAAGIYQGAMDHRRYAKGPWTKGEAPREMRRGRWAHMGVSRHDPVRPAIPGVSEPGPDVSAGLIQWQCAPAHLAGGSGPMAVRSGASGQCVPAHLASD